MKKRIAVCLVVILLTLCLTALAATTEQRVFDQAELFSADEQQQIKDAIEEFTQETGMDFVVLTSDQSHGNSSQQAIADQFYLKYEFGADDGEHSGALYYIDMYERLPHLSTKGKMINYVTDLRFDRLDLNANDELRNGDYCGAVLSVLSDLTDYYREGVPSNQNRYDTETGEWVPGGEADYEPGLTGTGILIACAGGLIAMLIFIFSVKRKYLLKGSTYHYDYQANTEVELTQSTDQYLRTTTTRTRKVDSDSNGGGHGSGGTGVHSSGGSTFGGGTGRGF